MEEERERVVPGKKGLWGKSALGFGLQLPFFSEGREAVMRVCTKTKRHFFCL